MTKRAFKGIWIPSEIWLNENLTIQEKVFLVEIDSLDNNDGCFANNNYFANFFKLSKNRCSEVIKKLEKKGLITISYTYVEGTKQIDKRIIKVVNKFFTPSDFNDTPSKSRLTPSESRLTPSEKCEDNNTINNTNNNNNIYSNIAENDIEEVQKTNKKLELENNIEEIRKLYKGTKTKQKAYTKLTSLLKDYSKEELIRTVTRYNQYVYTTRNTGFNLKFQNESTFWNGGYIDYLDSNFNMPNINSNEDKSKIDINTQVNANTPNVVNNIGFVPDWE